jgi:hypothetical protein
LLKKNGLYEILSILVNSNLVLVFTDAWIYGRINYKVIFDFACITLMAIEL